MDCNVVSRKSDVVRVWNGGHDGGSGAHHHRPLYARPMLKVGRLISTAYAWNGGNDGGSGTHQHRPGYAR